jgi:hypothetical protein
MTARSIVMTLCRSDVLYNRRHGRAAPDDGRQFSEKAQPVESQYERAEQVIGAIDDGNGLQRQADNHQTRGRSNAPEQTGQQLLQRVRRHPHHDDEEQHREENQAGDAECENGQKVKERIHVWHNLIAKLQAR